MADPAADDAAGPAPTESLERSAARGGVYLALRESVGIFVRLGGILLLTLEIGPTNYGIYVTAAGIVSVVALIAQLGGEVFLIRQTHEPSDDTYHQVGTTLLVWTAFVMAISLVATHWTTSLLNDPKLVTPLRVMLISLPINVLWAPAQAKIERAFRYRAMGLLELGGDITLYVVSAGLALFGFGLWAPVIGYIAWQAWLLIGSWTVSGMQPTWRWNRQAATDIGRFGGSYLSSTLFGQGLTLVNPIVVGHYLGPRVVGQIALGLRMVDSFSFVGRATWRLSLVLFGRVSEDLARLQNVLGKVMAVQVLVLAPVYAVISLAAPFFIGRVFGHDWKSAIVIFPYLATRSLCNAITLSLVTVGYALNKTRMNVWAAGVSLTSQVVVAVILVPRYGSTGYALSEIASLAGAFVLHAGLSRMVSINYLEVLPWMIGFIPIFYFPITASPWQWLLFVPLVLIMIPPGPRHQLRDLAAKAKQEIDNRRSRRHPPAPVVADAL